MNFITSLSKYFKHHRYLMTALVVIVVLATAVFSRIGGKKEENQAQTLTRVSTISLKDYQANLGFVSASGTVESLEQADLRSQANGPVSRVYAKVGDAVRENSIILTIENRDQAASLASAQAILKSQEARLDELKRGARTEEIAVAETRVKSAQQTLEDTKKQQDVAVKNAQSALFNTGLQAIPSSGNVSKSAITITGTYSGEKEGTYLIRVYNSGTGPRFFASGIENADGMVRTNAPEPLGKLGLSLQFNSTNVYGDDTWTIDVPNKQSASYTQVKNAYDSAVQGRVSAVNAAQSQLDSAKRDLELRLAGASNEQIRAQQASVDQARASVAAAASQYDKTIVRTPIAGTIANVTVKYGELLTPGQAVASVVSKGGMQIKAFISEADIEYITQDAEVTINENVKGKVSRWSPSVNPVTKTAEVQIVVIDPEKSGLTVGQNANIKIATAPSGETVGGFKLPVQSVQITQNGAYVFVVNSENILEEKKVEIGAVTGETVEVKSGLNSNMTIVSTVYELKAGQKVSVQ